MTAKDHLIELLALKHRGVDTKALLEQFRDTLDDTDTPALSNITIDDRCGYASRVMIFCQTLLSHYRKTRKASEDDKRFR